jgi:hypothetical protein
MLVRAECRAIYDQHGPVNFANDTLSRAAA